MKLQTGFLTSLIVLTVLGQIVFAALSSAYMKPFYENRVFATTGIQFDGSDLHKLNEGAHYFGQTMIGWTKFPSFTRSLLKELDLPVQSSLNMHMQERQNIILTLKTSDLIAYEKLYEVKDYLQDRIDEYNSNTNTRFVLTNVDYEQIEVRRGYLMGSIATFILTTVAALMLAFVRREFFPPKLKL